MSGFVGKLFFRALPRDGVAHATWLKLYPELGLDRVRISPGNKFLGCLLLISNADHIATGPCIALALENLPLVVTDGFDSLNIESKAVGNRAFWNPIA